ncbi:MAG: polysaccharide deacetylase family protein [Methanomassiliicoccales archaeon]|jgi:peptidoglycan/xylan/chitin deacetylase (PgdA/CDA1 family)
MRQCSFTVDVDRDVNQSCDGQVCAVSAPRDGSNAPRFASSTKGLETIVDVLDSLDVKGTFFFEARTAMEISRTVDLPSLMKGHEIACHGYDHEDLTGHKSGLPLSRAQVDDVLERSISVLREIFGSVRFGFRAPYQACDGAIEEALFDKGFIYDSSKVRSLQDGPIWPYRTASGIIEVPVASGIDPRGKKIVGYLWPMHEGKRTVDDYVHLMEQADEGLLVMATHTWHLMENFSSGLYSKEEAKRQKDLLHELLSKGLDMCIELVRIDDHLADKGVRE